VKKACDGAEACTTSGGFAAAQRDRKGSSGDKKRKRKLGKTEGKNGSQEMGCPAKINIMSKIAGRKSGANVCRGVLYSISKEEGKEPLGGKRKKSSKTITFKKRARPQSDLTWRKTLHYI